MQIAEESMACAEATPSDPRTLRRRDFREVVGPHVTRLVALARNVLRSDDLAWDAVQDGLTALWLEGTRPNDTRAWLARTVLNRSLHASRTRRRLRKHETRARERRPETVSRDDPFRILEQEELRSMLAEALGQLGDEYREVIELREYHGLDYTAISETLGIPDGTVRSRLNRARSILRTRLRPLVSDPCDHADARRTDHDVPSCSR
jgi:RNA polymerase sigma-70 factor (ECF subfamily)